MTFRWDFAGFLGGAVLCSLPVMAFVRASVYDQATERRYLHGVRLPTPTPVPLTTSAPVKPGTVHALSIPAADLCGLDRALFWRLLLRESGGRHYAADGSVLRSSAGAIGAAQVKPSTARELDPRANIEDPWQNLVIGACLFRQFIDERGGDVRAALHDYHAGKWRKRTTTATRNYASDVIGSAQ